MDYKKFLNYLSSGLTLANSNPHLFLIEFLLSEYFLLGNILPQRPPMNRILLFLLVLPHIAFSLTLPLFLKRSQHGEKDSFGFFFSETLHSLKRSFLQVLLVMFLTGFLFIALIFGVVLLAKLANIPYEALKNMNFQEINIGYVFFVLFSSFTSILFSYTAIFFSLEKDSLITALRKGFVMLRQYTGFTLWVFCLNVILSLLVNMLTRFLPFRDIFYSLILTYFSFAITTTILVFYQKKIISEEKQIL